MVNLWYTTMYSAVKNTFKHLRRLAVAGLLSFGFVWLAGCELYSQSMENSAGDNYFSDMIVTRLVHTVQDAIVAHDSGMNMGHAAVMTFSSVPGEKKMEMRYGVDYVTDYDGFERKGTVTTTWDRSFFIPGSTMHIVMENEHGTNGWATKGFIDVTNWGLNEWDQPMYEVRCSLELISPAYNWEWTNEYIRVKISRDSTPQSTDDLWSVTGTAYARNRQGRFYNAFIKDSLYYSPRCKYGYTRGKVDIQHVDATQRLFVVYGEGTDTACSQYMTFDRGKRKLTVTKNLK